MRKNVKKRSFMLGVLFVAYLLVGCNSDTNTANVVSTENVIEITESSSEKDLESSVIQENDSTGGTECPEGYVYDYQVSMEPIPEEIAVLGGPCQGTIHAYPSKIAMALTELEMEKDSVLKEEVEKRIPEVEAALEEEYGGEFVVDGVVLDDDYSWTFFCTETETGYQFDLAYYNTQYNSREEADFKELINDISLEDYYDERKSDKIREDLTSQIKEIFGEGDIKIRRQNETGVTDIFIAEYLGNTADLKEEQIKLIKIWEILQDYDSEEMYNLCLTVYPPDYKTLIKEKFSGMFRSDFGNVMSEETALALIESGDICYSLSYIGIYYASQEKNMNYFLKQYQERTYDENEIWKFWSH